ncbi:MAG: cytochrome c biogenesis CcdA family protein [Burkholderiales bacterium]
MEFGPGTYGLGYAAGILTTLSPCVLPLVPIVVATALAAHRLGPYALALGLTVAFASVGVFVAVLGASLGLDRALLRNIAAVILIAFGILLLSTGLQQRIATAASGLSAAGDSVISRLNLNGLTGQFVIGMVLGVVWSPCVGPTLGAATTLASQGQNLAQISLLMVIFGLGASTPLVALGSISRASMVRMRGRMLSAGKLGKSVLGIIFVLLGIAILSGFDKSFEAWAVGLYPDWLNDLTTRY